AEVWGGQALLSAAVLQARDLVPDPALSQQLGRAYNNLRSVTQILRSHNAQVTGCTNSCHLSEVLTVPDTKVNFNEWKKMDVSLHGAAEVWGGQALLSAAVLQARDLVPDPALSQQLGRAYNNLRSVTQILRSHNAQVTGTGAGGGGQDDGWRLWVNGETDGEMGGWIEGCIWGGMDRWMDWVDGQMDGWMDR
uniref:Erythropoietin n=1 Tax=Chelydra serpentina TaxID=8475 RepID=A0A8C3SCB2_CHESE